MPHVHTGPDQHDMTVSMYIVRQRDGEPEFLVHMHRSIGKLMQLGGHVELTEFPWQSVGRELGEESGYDLRELELLQPVQPPASIYRSTVHPLPVLHNTFKITDQHYHTDLCFVFTAKATPRKAPAEGESSDLRWHTMPELVRLAQSGELLRDTYDICTYIADHVLGTHRAVNPLDFALSKPSLSAVEA